MGDEIKMVEEIVNKFKDENGKMDFKKVASHYDRSVVVVLTALGVITATYFSIGSRIDTLVRGTPIVKELQSINAVQEKTNQYVQKTLDKMDEKLDKLLSRR